jgi:hypothetical protein
LDSQESLSQHTKDKHSQGTKQLDLKIKKNTFIFISLSLLIIVGIIYFVYQALSNPYSGMGSLGSTHIHADIAIYLNGKPITPFSTKYFLKSRYIHVEHGPGAGYVIHMHATNIPLGFFFKSLGMSFSKDCFYII